MEKYSNFSLFIILIPTPDFPHFYYMLGGNLGSLLYGDVSVMSNCIDSTFDLKLSMHKERDQGEKINHVICSISVK